MKFHNVFLMFFVLRAVAECEFEDSSLLQRFPASRRISDSIKNQNVPSVAPVAGIDSATQILEPRSGPPTKTKPPKPPTAGR
mmetsp:Transcript_3153/g.9192  ORF Transcript_3153/g.9192 Transcript_3153/m.9192 type:complete len:82 (+) Transcript_3153:54-299(+)